MKKIILFLFIGTCLGLVSFIQSDWKTLTYKGSTMKHPADWEPEMSGTLGANFFLYAPAKTEKDAFRDNINYLIQDLAGQKMKMDSYVELSVKQINSLLTNAKLIENKRLKDGTREKHKLIYTGDYQSKSLRFEQYFWIIGEKACILTLTTLNNGTDVNVATGQKILDTFQLKK